MGEVYGQKVKSDDPEFYLKNTIIQNNNYLHDNAAQDKDRMHSKIYFAVSIVLGILSAFFVMYINLISIIILIDLLMILLVLSAREYSKRRKKFWLNRGKMKESFKDFGLEWRN